MSEPTASAVAMRPLSWPLSGLEFVLGAAIVLGHATGVVLLFFGIAD